MAVVDDLKKALANTFALALKTQNYHWNVRGLHFEALHGFFEKQYSELYEASDEIAEHLRTFQEIAPGSLNVFAEISTLKEPDGLLSAENMIRDLLNDHETIIKELRQAAKDATDGGDDLTADLYIERGRAHEKTAWMLRSHIQ